MLNPPALLMFAFRIPQHANFGHITPLEPPADPPKNAAASIDMENRVVLGGNIAEDVRLFTSELNQI